MVGISEKATELHESGFNCAQSVLCSCGKYTGLDEKTALAVSGGFGGGIRCGEVCGALSGAVMALGLAYPYTNGEDKDAKDKIAKLTKKCTAEFKEQFGCVRCLQLKRAKRSCKELIEYAAGLAEKIITENE